MSLRLFAAACTLIASTVVHADGAIDVTFGDAANGRAILPFDQGTPPNDEAAALLLDADNRFYVVGQVRDANGFNQVGMTRLRPSGSVDASFGIAGRSVTSSPIDKQVVAAAFAGNGNVLVTWRRTQGNSSDIGVCHHDRSTGQVAPFPGSVNSCAYVQFVTGRDSVVRDIVVQPDGKFLLIGYTQNLSGKYVGSVARLNPDGSRDTAFGSNGIALLDLGDQTYLTAGVWDPYGVDGVVLCGTIRTPSRIHNDMLVAKIGGDDGTFVEEFSGNGWRAYDLDLGNYSEACNAIAVRRDGTIYAAGQASADGVIAGAILQIAPGGNPILQFADGGRVIQTGTSFIVTDLRVRSDGTPIVAGTRLNNGTTDLHVVAFTASGNLQASYGAAGQRSIDFGLPGQNESAAGLVLQNGRAVVAGSTLAGAALSNDFAAARLDGDVIFADGFTP